MAFDVDGARKAGYSETEIADHLAKQSNFDAAGARKAGYSDAEIIAHVRPKAENFEAKPTKEQEQLASAPMRVAKGMKDPIDGAAQLASRAPGAGLVNSAADAVGGFLNRNVFNTPTFNRLAGLPEGYKSDFAGEVLGIRGATPEQLQAETKAAEGQYQAARTATATRNPETGEKDPGTDWMRILGNAASPVNVAAGRVLPLPKGGDTMRMLAGKGALGGGVGAATQPVLGEDYWSEKVGQVFAGTVAGGVLTPALSALTKPIGRVMEAIQRRMQSDPTARLTPEAIRSQVRASLEADGVDVSSIPDVVFKRLADDATSAAAKGQKLDATSALRAQDFDSLGLPYLKGQVGRDPAQWQREFNLMGVEGAGDPIRSVVTRQSDGVSKVLQGNSAKAADKFNAGEALLSELQGANKTAEDNVRAAYKAFRDSTGRELEVPLQGLAQDYSQTLRDFGDSIPAAVRRQFEELGLMSGAQRKLMTIEDAENLVKVINKNFDPKNTAGARALGELRSALQKSVTEAVDAGDNGALGAEAAALAKEARGTAAARFKMIEDTPALKAAIDNMEPDQFVDRFVLGGRVNQIERMQSLLGPEGRHQVQAQTWAYLRDKAFGANAAGDGKAAQATFNNALKQIGRPKLVALLGEEGANEAQRIGRVLAYMKQAPEGAVPNNSGTTPALLNALQGVRGIKNLPYLNDFVVRPVQGFADRRAAQAAVNSPLTSTADLDPATVNALARLLSGVPVNAGVAAGGSVGQ